MKITEDGMIKSLVRARDKFSGIENALYDHVIFFKLISLLLKVHMINLRSSEQTSYDWHIVRVFLTALVPNDSTSVVSQANESRNQHNTCLPGDKETVFMQICFNPENLQEHFTIYGIP